MSGRFIDLTSDCSLWYFEFMKQLSIVFSVLCDVFWQNHYKDRNSTGRGRNYAPVRSPRSNGRTLTPLETNFSERSNEFSQMHGKSWPPDLNNGSPIRKPYSTSNGSLQPCEGSVEFVSFGHQPLATPPSLSQERGRQPISVSAPLLRTSASHSTPGAVTEWPSVNGLKPDR